MYEISETLKKYRKKLHLSQNDLADKLHVTKQAISKWETKRGYPDSSLIPLIAKELGISIDTLMGQKKPIRRQIILLSAIIFFVLIVSILTPIIIKQTKEKREYNNFITDIETKIDMDLPTRGKLVSVDFTDWQMYENEIQIDKMSYVVFSDKDQIADFNSEISSGSEWFLLFDAELLKQIPTSIVDYIRMGDYFLIYNVDTDTINDITISDGTYEFNFMIYQPANNRLIVFDYSIDIWGGN